MRIHENMTQIHTFVMQKYQRHIAPLLRRVCTSRTLLRHDVNVVSKKRRGIENGQHVVVVNILNNSGIVSSRTIQSDGPSLQTVLGGKYGLPEPIVVEGRFVIIDGDQATSMVCLGLESESLVVADIVSSGSSMNYELQSLVPLSVLTIAYRSSNQTLDVRSEFGDTLVFQLCSCENKTDLWDLFTSTINELYPLEGGGESLSLTSVDAGLKSSADLVSTESELRRNVLYGKRPWYSDTSILRIYPKVTEGPLKKFTDEESLGIEKKYPKVTEFEIIKNVTSEESLFSSDSCSSILQIYANDARFEFLERFTSAESLWSTNTFVLRKYSKVSELQPKIKLEEIEGTYPKLTESGVSLPAKLPSQSVTWYGDIIVKFHSVSSLDTKCDDSVIATIMSSLKDASNNDGKNNKGKQQQKSGNKLVKFLRGCLLCCIRRK